jgi:endonuclease IV
MLGFHIGKNCDSKKRTWREAVKDINLVTSHNLRPCAQIFVMGPLNTKVNLTTDDKAALREFAAKYDLVVHGAYVNNPWGENSAAGVLSIKQEMTICAEIGAKGLVIHLAAGANNDDNLRNVLTELSNLPARVINDVILYLEINTAKQSHNTFETPQKINRLFDRINGLGLPLRTGLCIDTAHVFSCGVALYEYNKTMEWLNAIEGTTEIMFHLNDSASSLGSGKDKHHTLTEGKLWGDFNRQKGGLDLRESGLMAVLEWAEANDSIVILERGDGLDKDINLIASLGYFQIKN